MKRIAIIGGGISGLSALHFIRTRHNETCRAVLYERDSRLGGTIGTDRINGFVSDWGPNGFLDKVPLTLQMIHELGADSQLDPSRSASGKRFIYRRHRLHEISPSPVAFLRSPLLSLKGRLRIVREPFVKTPRADDDESVFDFAVRRIGREAAETLIVPMVSGIFGGDAHELSLKSCFPVMREMEDEYRSLFKAMIKRRKAAKKTGGESAGPAGPGGRLTSFKNGLHTLIEVFAETYRDEIITNHPIQRVVKDAGRYRLVGDSGKTEPFDAIICAAPTYAAVPMVSGIDTELADVLDGIPYASIAVVSLGFKREVIGRELDGFGFLIPRREGLRILGSIWTSSIFSERAPEGMVLMRTMIGGATDPDAAALSDGALLDIVTGELKSIINITDAPAYVRIYKYDCGIPQFVVGHPARMKRLEGILRNHPGLYFTGNAYQGVGLNDCVLRSDRVVGEMTAYLNLDNS
jgi:oxygen-dependent protoporphyrinogen oxidase